MRLRVPACGRASPAREGGNVATSLAGGWIDGIEGYTIISSTITADFSVLWKEQDTERKQLEATPAGHFGYRWMDEYMDREGWMDGGLIFD